jgi:cell division protein FtsB
VRNIRASVSFTTYVKERWGYFALLGGVMYFMFIIRSDLVQNARLKDEKKELQNNLALEENKMTYLNDKMARLKSSSYIELIAREKLELIGKGEKAYKVIFKD